MVEEGSDVDKWKEDFEIINNNNNPVSEIGAVNEFFIYSIHLKLNV